VGRSFVELKPIAPGAAVAIQVVGMSLLALFPLTVSAPLSTSFLTPFGAGFGAQPFFCMEVVAAPLFGASRPEQIDDAIPSKHRPTVSMNSFGLFGEEASDDGGDTLRRLPRKCMSYCLKYDQAGVGDPLRDRKAARRVKDLVAPGAKHQRRCADT
jgi:hypothetical protein